MTHNGYDTKPKMRQPVASAAGSILPIKSWYKKQENSPRRYKDIKLHEKTLVNLCVFVPLW
jgi:hypothetical protein